MWRPASDRQYRQKLSGYDCKNTRESPSRAGDHAVAGLQFYCALWNRAQKNFKETQTGDCAGIDFRFLFLRTKCFHLLSNWKWGLRDALRFSREPLLWIHLHCFFVINKSSFTIGFTIFISNRAEPQHPVFLIDIKIKWYFFT